MDASELSSAALRVDPALVTGYRVGSVATPVFWAPGSVSGCTDAHGPALAAEALPALTAAEAADVLITRGMQRVLHHMEHIICGGNAAMYAWMLGYIACLLRAPGDKRGSPALLIVGPQGAGKDAFVHCLRLLIGSNLTLMAAGWAAAVGTAAAGLEPECTLLVWVQEERLDHEACWIESAKRQVAYTSCARVITTAASIDATLLGEQGRDFCVVKAAGTYVGDIGYLNRLFTSMSSPRVQRKLFDFFTTTDSLLDGWDALAFPKVT